MKLGKSLSHSAFPAAGPPTGSESSLVPCMGFVIDKPHHHLPLQIKRQVEAPIGGNRTAIHKIR